MTGFVVGVAGTLFQFLLLLLAFAELLRSMVDMSHATMRTAIVLEARRR